MNSRFNVVTIFVLGLCASSFILSPAILDFTLTPRFIALSITLFVTLGLLFFQKTELKVKQDKIILCYALYILYCFVSILWSKNTAEAFFEASRQCLAFVVFLMSYYFMTQNPKAIWKILDKFCIIIVFIGLALAFYQLNEIKKMDKDSIYVVTGLNGHKNLFASFLFLNLFFLIKTYFTNSKWLKYLSALAILISLMLLVFLRTKAVFLGLSVTFLVGLTLLIYLKINRKFKVNTIISVIFCMIITNIFFLIVLKPIIAKGIKYNSEININKKEAKDELDNERLILWQKSFEMFKKHPINGVGAGNWQIYFPDATLSGLWRAEDLNYTFQRPHNDFLWLLCEYGIIGFNLFLAFLFFILISLLKTLKNGRSVNDKLVIILCVAFIHGYFTISFFDFPKERIEHLIWVSLIFATAYFYIKKNEELKSEFSVIFKKPALALGVFIFLFFAIIGALRYKGEFFTRKMYDAKNNTIYYEVIRLGNKAQSFAYNLDPTSVPIYWYVGNAKASLKQFNEVRIELKKAYSFNPYNRNVISDLASAEAMSNNTEKAIELYKETSRISPRFDEAKLNLTALYIQEKKYKEALDCLKSIQHDSERRTKYTQIVEAFIALEKTE